MSDAQATDAETKGSAVGAMWGMIWRSVAYFPLGIVLFVVPVGIMGLFTWLAAWAVAFGLMHEWWWAAACFAGLPIPIVLWRWTARFL